MRRTRSGLLWRHRITIFGLLAAFLFSAIVSFAAPPGSPYSPGETLDPSCAPGDANCYVESGAIITVENSTSLFSTGLADTGTNSIATNAIFFGAGAGYEATNADHSVFLGEDAGRTAANADNSNFFGQNSGEAAGNAEYANFFGYSAGQGASDAYNSNFFGFQSGTLSTDAHNSNFFGSTAGQLATNAYQSNFFGQSAGFEATFASDSNFFGYQAGSTATNANDSNFFGNNAGNNASGAHHSNFFGAGAGSSAANASSSIFLGTDAGKTAVNANNAIFLGYRAGFSDNVDNSSSGTSILIGQQTRTGGFSNSIAIGRGTQNSAAQQFNIGNVLFGTGIYNSDTPSATPVAGGFVGIGDSSPDDLLNLTSAASQAALAITSLGSDTDALIKFELADGTATFSMGVDDSDSDKFKISTTALGTSDRLTIDASGNIAIPAGELYVNSTTDAGAYALQVTGDMILGGLPIRANSNGSISFNGINPASLFSTMLFGQNAGLSATDAGGSIFLGEDAGRSASNAAASNFFGYRAGYFATNAYGSTFMGSQAGFGATNANYAIFLGDETGKGATNAVAAIFLGQGAGGGATGATGASASIFIGSGSGQNATAASEAIFVGSSAGNDAAGANNSIFIGKSAGQSDTVDNSSSGTSILIGQNTRTGGFSNSIAIGRGTQNSATRQLNIGNVIYADDIYNSDTPSSTPVSTGQVGIGNNAPAVLLHVGSSSVTDASTLIRTEDANSTCNFTADNGGPTCGSDRTLKKDIESLDTVDLLSRVVQLNPVSYRWKTEDDTADLQFGFIAQEVEAQFPNLVTESDWIDGTTRKFLNMGGLMPYAIGAIKEIDLRIAPLVSYDDPSFTERLKEFFAGIAERGEAVVEKLFAKRVQTEELCVTDEEGDVCISAQALRTLLNGADVDTGDSDPEPAPQDETTEAEPVDPPAEETETESENTVEEPVDQAAEEPAAEPEVVEPANTETPAVEEPEMPVETPGQSTDTTETDTEPPSVTL